MAEPAKTPTPTSSVKLSDSMCALHYAASLKCLDEANYDKSKCQEFFDAYKECKKQESPFKFSVDLILVAMLLTIRRENYDLKPTGNRKGFSKFLQSAQQQYEDLLSLYGRTLINKKCSTVSLLNTRVQQSVASAQKEVFLSVASVTDVCEQKKQLELCPLKRCDGDQLAETFSI